MAGSASSSQPLLNANAPHDHERYRDTDMQLHDIEASLDSLEETELAIYPLRSNSPAPYDEKHTQRGRDLQRSRSRLNNGNRRRYAAIALILVFLVSFAIFSIVHVSSTDETRAETVPEDRVKSNDPDAGASEHSPAFSPYLLGPPAESFWGELGDLVATT